MQQIVRVESSGNPFAIGVVGGSLVRQPTHVDEALATADSLRRTQRNFSIGLAQINQVHFQRLGWSDDLRRGFDQCANVAAGAGMFNACYQLALARGYTPDEQRGSYTAIHAALSCYYSGDLLMGARLGYVDRVLGVSASAPERAAARRLPSMMLSFKDK
jgi:type IV secretion system protein VirB1